MKTIPSPVTSPLAGARLLLSAAALALAASLPAQVANGSREVAYARSVSEVVMPRGVVEIGTVRDDVLNLVGRPTTIVSESTWLYEGRFRAQTEAPDQHGCTTLLVKFNRQYVVELKLVNRPAAAIIAKVAGGGREVRYRFDDKSILAAEAPPSAASDGSSTK